MSSPSSMFALILFFFASAIADVVYVDPDGPYYALNPSASISSSVGTSQDVSAASIVSKSSSWLSSLTTGAGWTYSDFYNTVAAEPTTKATSTIDSSASTYAASLMPTIATLQDPHATSAFISTSCPANVASAGASMPSAAFPSTGYFNNGTVSSVGNASSTERNVSTAVGPTPSTLSMSFTGLAIRPNDSKIILALAAAGGLFFVTLIQG